MENIDMARSENNLNAVFTDTANAIRAKTDTTATICPRDFADKINAIQTGGGVMKAYFEAGGKCAYSNAKTFDGIINYSDTENVTSFSNMFYYSSRLSAIPNINFSKARTTERCFSYCTSIKTANITADPSDMSSMFSYCSNLTDLNLINNNKIERVSCSYLANSANALKTVNLNIPRCSTLSNAFAYSGVVSANLGEFHKQTGESIQGMIDSYNVDYRFVFYQCPNLEEVTMDIGSIMEERNASIDLAQAFSTPGSAESRTTPLTITFLNAHADVRRFFDYCFKSNDNIRVLPAVNCTRATGLDTAFSGCHNLIELKFYNILSNINISDCTKMTREALVEVLNNLHTLVDTRVCTLGKTNLAKLTDEDKAIATNKGWTLA